MNDHKSMLCVGGPRGGERYAILKGSGFTVPVRQEEESALADLTSESYQPNRKPKIEFTDYRAEVFHTPQGDVSFWVPAGQTPLETITILLEAYERAAKPQEPKP